MWEAARQPKNGFALPRPAAPLQRPGAVGVAENTRGMSFVPGPQPGPTPFSISVSPTQPQSGGRGGGAAAFPRQDGGQGRDKGAVVTVGPAQSLFPGNESERGKADRGRLLRRRRSPSDSLLTVPRNALFRSPLTAGFFCEKSLGMSIPNLYNPTGIW